MRASARRHSPPIPTPRRSSAYRPRQREIFHIGRRHVRDEAMIRSSSTGGPRSAARSTGERRPTGWASRCPPVRLRRTDLQLRDEHSTTARPWGLRSDCCARRSSVPRRADARHRFATSSPTRTSWCRRLDSVACIQGRRHPARQRWACTRGVLLYTYPARLRRSGVSSSDPTGVPALHRQVLPALARGGIQQSTVTSLSRIGPVRANRGRRAPTLKGDARLASLRRAVFSHVGPPRTEWWRWSERSVRIRPAPAPLRDDARRADVRWSVIRERLRARSPRSAASARGRRRGAVRRRDRSPGRSPPPRVRRQRVAGVRSIALLTRLYSDTPSRRCGRALTDDEARAAAPPGALTTLDRRRRRAHRRTGRLLDGAESYVHVVVDEAQDLCRCSAAAVARPLPARLGHGAGRPGQATTRGPRIVARSRCGTGPRRRSGASPDRRVRVPGEVLEVANRLSAHRRRPPATSYVKVRCLSYTDDLVGAVAGASTSKARWA